MLTLIRDTDVLKTQLLEARIEGRAEGRAEIAKSMKADKLPTETIVKYTGLTAKEIDAL